MTLKQNMDRELFKIPSEAYTMGFKNIRRNIMYLLGNEWLKSGILGPFDIKLIFNRFSDIPDKNIKDALRSINKKGLVELTSNYHNISLTQKGLSKIKVINLPENGKLPLPKQLE
ncbi:MAG: hypothetical protein PVG87_26940 [Desulfobacteraceae bacterium]|jgi:hypothetical protein